jgi:hypothetical protein
VKKGVFGRRRIDAFLADVSDEYGASVATECRKVIEGLGDGDDIEPTRLLRAAKRACGHDGERLLMELRKKIPRIGVDGDAPML